MQESLFDGRSICLAALEPDQDAETAARWTQDPEYLQLYDLDPPRPLSVFQVKKKFEEWDKQQGEQRFTFAIWLREDDRLVGIASLRYLDWSNGHAHLKISIGEAQDRGRGYEEETLQILLRYAFHEISFHRVSVTVLEYQVTTIEMLRKAGFKQEVCRRQAFFRHGRRWDQLIFGILRSEWNRKEPA